MSDTSRLQKFGLGPRNTFLLDPQTGEWNRVLRRAKKDSFVVDIRPRQTRELDEVEQRRSRRWFLVFMTAGVVMGLMVIAYGKGHRLFWITDAGILLAGSALFLGFIPALHEILYLLGVQWIRGAKVLDPAPVPHTRKQVANQKAHGDARLATETEARTAAARGSNRRSAVHDQEF